MFLRSVVLVAFVFGLGGSEAWAFGHGLFARHAARREVVLVEPVAVVQKVRVRQQILAAPVYSSSYSSFSSYVQPSFVQQVYAPPVIVPQIVAPVFAQPVYQQQVQYAAPPAVAPAVVQPQAVATSLDLQLGDLANLLRKLNCVAGCFATP